MAASSSRILLDIPCKVCQDHSSGKHYGIFACDGCAGFFKRSIRRNRHYVCKNRGSALENHCQVDKTHRNQCRACRLKKCCAVGMNKDAVQHERGPRHSTIRRQMAMYFKDDFASAAATTAASTGSTPSSGTGPAARNPTGSGLRPALPNGPSTGVMPPMIPPGLPLSAFPFLFAAMAPSLQPALQQQQQQPTSVPGFGPVDHSVASLFGTGSAHGAAAATSRRQHNNLFMTPPQQSSSSSSTEAASGAEPKKPQSNGRNVSAALYVEPSSGHKTVGDKVSAADKSDAGTTSNPCSPTDSYDSPESNGSTTHITMDEQTIKEHAARLLFMSISWPKTLPQFMCLAHDEQMSILGDTWPQLFTLTALQFGLLKPEILTKLRDCVPDCHELIDVLRQAAEQFDDLQPDAVEYSCLRAMLLMKGNTTVTDQMKLAIARYDQIQYSAQPLRSIKLFMLLQAMDEMNDEKLEQLFFKDSIGNVSMKRLVCDLYMANHATLMMMAAGAGGTLPVATATQTAVNSNATM